LYPVPKSNNAEKSISKALEEKKYVIMDLVGLYSENFLLIYLP